ncbi:DUF6631 family protein [Xanthomonas citri]|uniref:DUF6631 family protein n=1 Tax=Xanthomonas citri TaxID=346 RepID=UPI0001CECD22|nr:DUF6631 family protein [Xanthomonas citri]AMV00332.1 hypothetical protein TP37_21245 [Xanthomonas citri pv. aurantifolii]AMV04648.1 hypothetical protein TP50_21040 [Xanthomonas citri pv. aurantifolii]EFF46468.1 hypothetical protein XAUC_31160 [Xanthomonas citri pv. aurantifolii str. ICPB 10535]MCC8491384.1 hypothetical protein [Xanthomonas citri pv. fuscans]TBW97648.1 hypothetical protein TP47_10880 [Xanthomonas citri pv. aurantifolii]
MVTRLGESAKKASAAKPNAADASIAELDVLAPQRDVPAGGRIVTVREYGYFEGLRLLPQIKPFLDDLQVQFTGASAPTVDAIAELLATHVDLVQQLVARATVPAQPDAYAMDIAIGQQVQWMEALNEAEGDLLVLTWWMVNSPFFIRRVLRAAAQVAVAARSAGADSSTH